MDGDISHSPAFRVSAMKHVDIGVFNGVQNPDAYKNAEETRFYVFRIAAFMVKLASSLLVNTLHSENLIASGLLLIDVFGVVSWEFVASVVDVSGL